MNGGGSSKFRHIGRRSPVKWREDFTRWTPSAWHDGGLLQRFLIPHLPGKTDSFTGNDSISGSLCFFSIAPWNTKQTSVFSRIFRSMPENIILSLLECSVYFFYCCCCYSCCMSFQIPQRNWLERFYYSEISGCWVRLDCWECFGWSEIILVEPCL